MSTLASSRPGFSLKSLPALADDAPARPFDISALGDLALVGTPDAIDKATQAVAAFDDVIGTAEDMAALSDILRLYEFGTEDRTPAAHEDEDSQPFALVPIPSREDFEAVADFWNVSIDDVMEVHTFEDEVALLGYELGLQGERSAALPRDTPGRDDLIQSFANAKTVGLAAFRAREETRKARDKAREVGDDIGYHGFLCDPPYSMNPDEHRAFLAGYAAGERRADRERPRLYDESEAVEVFGHRAAQAVAEDAADRGEWAFA